MIQNEIQPTVGQMINSVKCNYESEYWIGIGNYDTYQHKDDVLESFYSGSIKTFKSLPETLRNIYESQKVILYSFDDIEGVKHSIALFISAEEMAKSISEEHEVPAPVLESDKHDESPVGQDPAPEDHNDSETPSDNDAKHDDYLESGATENLIIDQIGEMIKNSTKVSTGIDQYRKDISKGLDRIGYFEATDNSQKIYFSNEFYNSLVELFRKNENWIHIPITLDNQMIEINGEYVPIYYTQADLFHGYVLNTHGKSSVFIKTDLVKESNIKYLAMLLQYSISYHRFTINTETMTSITGLSRDDAHDRLEELKERGILDYDGIIVTSGHGYKVTEFGRSLTDILKIPMTW